MTTTYDPHHPQYTDEADVRGELTRVFDVCQGCRRCTDLCPTFPTLFDLLDGFGDQGAGNLTPDEQDRIVGTCHHCTLCAVECPYTPGLDERAVDVPRLMVRAEAMRLANGHVAPAQQFAVHLVARTAVLGRLKWLGSVIAGERVRRVVASAFGLASIDRLPPRARVRWSAWFDRRASGERSARRVTVFPGCIVEYRDVQVGKDLVGVYERNGIACDRTAAGCCAAPWLAAGDVERFAKVAGETVRVLADEIRSGGGDVVVPEPTCSYVLQHVVAEHVDESRRGDAELVAEHTHDAVDYLMQVHASDGLDTDFGGAVPPRIVHHAADHRRGDGGGLPARDLMALTGARVEVAPRHSSGTGSGGYDRGDVLSGDNTVANATLAETTGMPVTHPLSVVARAYGIESS